MVSTSVMSLYSMIFQKCIGSDMFAWIRHDAAEVCALPSALLVLPVLVSIINLYCSYR